MTALLMLAALISGGEAAEDAYARAYWDCRNHGKPLVVLIGQPTGCAPCARMHREMASADLKGVAFCELDAAEHAAKRLMQGTVIPQLYLRWQRDGQWYGRTVVGYQTPAQVAELIREAKAK